MSFTNIEDIIDQTNNLPKEISRNMKMLRVLDEDFSKKLSNALTLKKKFLSNYNAKAKGEISEEVFKQIERDFEDCSNLCDQKLEVSNECYYMIDSNLKKINELISLFEKDLKTNHSPNKIKKNSKLDESKTSNSFKNKNNQNKSKNNFIKKKTLRKPDYSSEREDSIPSNLNHLEDITYAEIDGKLDPKEPLFCFCNYVSYGNMVRCDFNSCSKQWFHFSCVGLTSLPKGKWYCSAECANQKKLKK